MEITKRPKPKRNVGEYSPNHDLGSEHLEFVKVLKIVKKDDWTITYGVDRNGYYFGWYNGIEPYNRDVKEYDCPKELISYEEGDCLKIIGFVKEKKTSKFFLNEDGDKPRWIRLERCRVIENAGSLTKENST